MQGGIIMKNTYKKAMVCAIALSVLHVTVFGTQWYDEAVSHGRENGIISEDFDIEGLLTRGEMAEMLSNVIGFDAYYTNVPFADIQAGNSVTDDIVTLYSAGIYSGSAAADDKLEARIGDALKREEAAAFIVRTYGFDGDGKELTFEDKDDISEYALKDISILVGKGIMSGYEDNTIRPKNNVSKAEFLTMLYKADEAAGGKTPSVKASSLISETSFSSNLRIDVLNESPVKADEALNIRFVRFGEKAEALYAYNPQEFQLERLENGQWTALGRNGSALTDIDYQLKADSESERKVTLSDLYDGLEDGEYRLVYRFAVNGVGIEKGYEYAAVNITIGEVVEVQ